LIIRLFAVLKALAGKSLNTAKFSAFAKYYCNLRSHFILKMKKNTSGQYLLLLGSAESVG